MGMMTTLEAARDALAGISSVATCKIGLESNVSPASYPLIRVVPSRMVPGAAYSGRTAEAFIYFGWPIAEADNGIEAVYANLYTLEASIIETLRTIGARYIETLADEDRLKPYKIMAIRCELHEPDAPYVKCAIHSTSTVLALDGTTDVVPIAPFTRILHNSAPLDMTPDFADGSIDRLLHGATSTRTKLTLTGRVAGPAGTEVSIGLYAAGIRFGNRVLVACAGAGAPIAFAIEATYYAEEDVALDARVAASEAGDFVFEDALLVAQKA